MAKTNWKELLGWNEEQLQDLRFVGYAYLKQGHFVIALDFFRALITLQSDNVYDLQTLGALYLELGKNLEALDYLDRALKINPLHYPTLLNRAKALLTLGYKKQGLVQARSLIRIEDPLIASQAIALVESYS